MTEPTNLGLLELATPYALHAVSDRERAEIEQLVAAAPSPLATAFNDEVRVVRETMALVSATTAAEPPAHVRAATLAATQPAQTLGRSGQSRWRTTLLASVAAAIVAGVTAVGIGVLMRPHPTKSVAEQIMAAPDVHSVSRPLGSGTATVVFSHDRNAAVLVMNNVPPPSEGHVYQIWLLTAGGPTSAGTMSTAKVTPSTTETLTDLGSSSALAFTLEPGNGSDKPTTPILAELPLS